MRLAFAGALRGADGLAGRLAGPAGKSGFVAFDLVQKLTLYPLLEFDRPRRRSRKRLRSIVR